MHMKCVYVLKYDICNTVTLSLCHPYRPGNFIVRPSQELDAFAISFRTNLEHNVIHWKVLKCDGKYTIHPRPHKYNTLQEVVMVRENKMSYTCNTKL